MTSTSIADAERVTRDRCKLVKVLLLFHTFESFVIYISLSGIVGNYKVLWIIVERIQCSVLASTAV